jgi:Fe2+ transport system protein FeoA
MRRREFIGLFGVAMTLWPTRAMTQPVERVWRVSHVLPRPPRVMGRLAQTFEQRLADLGYVPGRNLRLVHRFPEPKDAEELVVGLLPNTDPLVIWTTFGAVNCKESGLCRAGGVSGRRSPGRHRLGRKLTSSRRQYDRHNV